VIGSIGRGERRKSPRWLAPCSGRSMKQGRTIENPLDNRRRQRIVAFVLIAVAVGLQACNRTDAVGWSGQVPVERLTFDSADETTVINEFPAASPDGRSLLFQRSEDPETRKLADGKTVIDFQENSNWDIYRLALAGGKRVRLTDDPSLEDQPVWSPDGKTIVYRFLNKGSFDIYLMDADGQNKRPLVDFPKSDEKAPAFSPDSRKVVFFSNLDGVKWNLYTIDIETREILRLTKDRADDKHPQFTPDGKEIIFHSDRNSSSVTVNGDRIPLANIFSLDLSTGAIKQLTASTKHIDHRHPWISPDGRYIAYHANIFEAHPQKSELSRRDRRDLHIMTRDGTRSVNLTKDDPRSFKHPAWSADGKVIFCVFKEHKDGSWAIGRIDVTKVLQQIGKEG
jgi:Tol biopolymer transport system component